jgi:hypothetical protein
MKEAAVHPQPLFSASEDRTGPLSAGAVQKETKISKRYKIFLKKLFINDGKMEYISKSSTSTVDSRISIAKINRGKKWKPGIQFPNLTMQTQK